MYDTQEKLRRLNNRVMELISWPDFFASSGVKLTGEPDDIGWQDGEFQGSNWRFNVNTGEWSNAETGDGGDSFDFISISRDVVISSPEGLKRALRILCVACGIENEFDGIENPKAAGKRKPKPDPDHYEEHHLALLESKLAPILRNTLARETGISIDSLQQYRIGRTPKRKGSPRLKTVPVFDADGKVRSIRLVSDDFSSKWCTGRIRGLPRSQTAARIYGVDEMIAEKWDTVIVCDSELERIRIMDARTRADWGAVYFTDHEFDPEWCSLFSGRHVAIVPHDYKGAYATAERKIAPVLANSELPASVRVVRLPFKPEQPDRTLIHWFLLGGTWVAFERLIGAAPPFQTPAPAEKIREITNLSQIFDPKFVDGRVRVPICINGDSDMVFDSISKFRVEYCRDIEKGDCLKCQSKTFEIESGSADHIAMSGANEQQRDAVLRKICCPYQKRPRVEVIDKCAWREVYAVPYSERRKIRGTGEERVDQTTEQRVYVKIHEGRSEPIEPRGYTAEGWVRTNPSNSRRTLLIENMASIEEGHETFDFREANPELRRLQEMGWAGILRDLTEHRTRIYDQQEIILLAMLAYCSPLHLDFNNDRIRGWLTCAMVGDSGVGKTRVFESISDAAGVGDIFQCLTGKRTGLLYAVENTRNFWRCRAGVLPRATRKILCIDEAQSMNRPDMQSLAGCMDDKGILKVETIARGSYEAKTRLVICANPVEGKTISSYAYGCQALGELFDQMFIRRLDAAIFLRRSEDHKKYNRLSNKSSAPLIGEEELRTLIFFAWSLTPERVLFDIDVTRLILELAGQMSSIYGFSEDIPLVSPSDMRKTIARLAAAWAVLDLSSDDQFETIRVRPKHVQGVEKFLSAIYSSPDCGLDRYSASCRGSSSLNDFDAIAKEFVERLQREGADALEGKSGFGALVDAISRGDKVRKADLRRISGLSDGAANNLLTTLHTYRLISPDRSGLYQATKKLGKFMRRFAQTHPAHAEMIHPSKGEDIGIEG